MDCCVCWDVENSSYICPPTGTVIGDIRKYVLNTLNNYSIESETLYLQPFPRVFVLRRRTLNSALNVSTREG